MSSSSNSILNHCTWPATITGIQPCLIFMLVAAKLWIVPVNCTCLLFVSRLRPHSQLLYKVEDKCPQKFRNWTRPKQCVEVGMPSKGTSGDPSSDFIKKLSRKVKMLNSVVAPSKQLSNWHQQSSNCVQAQAVAKRAKLHRRQQCKTVEAKVHRRHGLGYRETKCMLMGMQQKQRTIANSDECLNTEVQGQKIDQVTTWNNQMNKVMKTTQFEIYPP